VGSVLGVRLARPAFPRQGVRSATYDRRRERIFLRQTMGFTGFAAPTNSSLIPALAALGGVLIGGLITAVTTAYFEKRGDRADVRQGRRLVLEELRSVWNQAGALVETRRYPDTIPPSPSFYLASSGRRTATRSRAISTTTLGTPSLPSWTRFRRPGQSSSQPRARRKFGAHACAFRVDAGTCV
jgi:hypothetical protein